MNSLELAWDSKDAVKKRKLRVAALATTPPYPSGLSYYSVYLYKELSKLCKVVLITNNNTLLRGNNEIITIPSFRAGPLALLITLRSIKRIKADILHVQLEYKFLGSWLNFLLLPIFFRYLRRLRCANMIVVTLHSIPTLKALMNWLRINGVPQILHLMQSYLIYYCWIVILRQIYELCDKLIVHNSIMATLINTLLHAINDKVVVIPHGSYMPPANLAHNPHRRNKRHILLMLGYMKGSKGVDSLLKAYDKLTRDGNDIIVIIAGRLFRTFPKSARRNDKQVKILARELDDGLLDRLIVSSSAIVLPYNDYFVESSGVLHRVSLFKKPVICTKVPKFLYDLSKIKEIPWINAYDHEKMAYHVTRIIKDEGISERIANELYKYFNARTWDKVGLLHYKLFNSLLM